MATLNTAFYYFFSLEESVHQNISYKYTENIENTQIWSVQRVQELWS